MYRRTLLQLGATAACWHIVPRHVLGGQGYIAPSEKIHLALIGCGGRGRQVLKEMMAEPDVQAIAVADPAKEFSTAKFYYKDVGGREPTKQMIEKHYQANDPKFSCKAYSNFEEMLAAEKDLDAIICGTPDHLHAYVSIKCMRAGKHVYCEKPLTHNIWEARQVARVAAETGVATQMGNQGHSSQGMRQTVELIRAGAIGTVRKVEAWVGGSRWNPALTGRPENEATPEGLDWNLWLGPRSERSYSSSYAPVAWRDFWAFGNSNIGDFACHDLDAACWALNLTSPTSIDFTPAGICNEEIGPHGCLGHYQFPAVDNRPALTVTWYDGGIKPAIPPGWPSDMKFPSRGVLFQGDDGMLFCGGAGGAPRLLGDNKFPAPPESIPRVKSHGRNWLDAIRGGEPAGSNFAYGAKLTEIALLGALSLRTSGPIQWDSQKMKAIGNQAADAIIKEDCREGWNPA